MTARLTPPSRPVRRPSRKLRSAGSALAASSNPALLQQFTRALLGLDFEVCAVRTACQAVRVARSRPDIAIIGFRDNTLAASRGVRAMAGGRCAIIAVGATIDDRFAQAAAECGADAFLEETSAGARLPPLIRLLSTHAADNCSVRAAEFGDVQHQDEHNKRADRDQSHFGLHSNSVWR